MDTRPFAILATQLKSLYSLATDKGITPSFVPEDVDEIVNSESLSDVEKTRSLAQLHRGIHELLYAPPRQ